MTMTAIGARHARPGESNEEVIRVGDETVEYNPETGTARRLTASAVGVPGPEVPSGG
jgi:hypothetical protein